MIWVYAAVGFIFLLICIKSFLLKREEQTSEEAEKAIASLRQCRRDVLRKADIFFVLPEENLWRFSLQTVITMSEDTLHLVRDILGQSIVKKNYRIYKNVIVACRQSEQGLRDTFSSIEAFLVDAGPSRHFVSETKGLVESPE